MATRGTAPSWLQGLCAVAINPKCARDAVFAKTNQPEGQRIAQDTAEHFMRVEFTASQLLPGVNFVRHRSNDDGSCSALPTERVVELDEACATARLTVRCA